MKQKLIKWHLNWKNLIDLIIKDEANCHSISSTPALNSSHCDLGSWLIYSANNHEEQSGSLDKLKECHENFHQLLESIIDDCQNSQYDQVKMKFPEFEKLSHELVELIEKLDI